LYGRCTGSYDQYEWSFWGYGIRIHLSMGEEYDEQLEWFCKHHGCDFSHIYPECYSDSDYMVPS
jgi:hypothetical protein